MTRLYYQPTVIDAVPENSLLNREETFGPIAPLITFSDDDEALRLTNNNALGLTAAVFTEDFRKGMWFAERIATGLVNINENGNYWELHIPFGGGTGKRSGIGRLGGKQTLMEMTALKSISVDIKRKG
jgi:acyl-CoA reductase-like NAD-dependent aldehyde dehydrogenase